MESPNEPVYSREKFSAAKERVENLLEPLPQEMKLEVYSKLAERAKYLRAKYPNANLYSMYHVVALGTVDEDMVQMVGEDFPGEDSVEVFLDKLTNDYFS